MQEAELLEGLKKENIQRCYQCAKCTSGCPTAYTMDFTPNRILKMLQLGMQEEVLSSSSIWFCISCETCVSRCPNEVNIPRIMDLLREYAIKSSRRIPEKGILAFHQGFLAGIKKHGRVHELGLLMGYKFKRFDLFSDLGLGIKMFAKGKIPLGAEKIEDIQVLQKIFEKARISL
jgi:heterodisulfide reductase subunit C